MKTVLPLTLLLAMLTTSCGNTDPAQIRIVNLVERAKAVSIETCDDAGNCRSATLKRDTMSPVFTIPPGEYSFAVWIGGEVVTRFKYGIGGAENYGLALYGIANPPVRKSWSTRITRLLGGTDQARPMGEQLSHRMVIMRPGKPNDPAQVRLANFAPGTSAISGAVTTGVTRKTFPSVRYGAVSDRVMVRRYDATVSVAFTGSPFALARTKSDFPAGSNSIIYLAGFDGARPRLLRDIRKVSR